MSPAWKFSEFFHKGEAKSGQSNRYVAIYKRCDTKITSDRSEDRCDHLLECGHLKEEEFNWVLKEVRDSPALEYLKTNLFLILRWLIEYLAKKGFISTRENTGDYPWRAVSEEKKTRLR